MLHSYLIGLLMFKSFFFIYKSSFPIVCGLVLRRTVLEGKLEDFAIIF